MNIIINKTKLVINKKNCICLDLAPVTNSLRDLISETAVLDRQASKEKDIWG